jgi:hypothetical protein
MKPHKATWDTNFTRNEPYTQEPLDAYALIAAADRINDRFGILFFGYYGNRGLK